MSIANIKFQTPHPAQAEILKCKKKRIVVNAGRQFGKTSLMLRICIEHMLGAKFKNKKLPSVLYVTPLTSLGVDIYKEILTLIPEELIVESNITRMYIKLWNGSTFRIISAESGAVAFRGKRHSLCVCDEFAHYKDAKTLFIEGIEPTLLSYDGGQVYFISTPYSQNYFFELYNRSKNKKLFPEWETFHFTSYDNPYLSKEYIDSKKEEYGELAFSQEMLGIFSSNKNNPFGDHILKNVIPQLANGRPNTYGIDLAKQQDFTVILGLKQSMKDANIVEVNHLDRWQGLDWVLTQEKIKLLPRSVEKLMDGNSIGDVVFDNIRQHTANLKAFKITSASKGNLIKELIRGIELGQIKYPQIVADELSTFEYSYNSVTGYLSYQAQQGFHDDIVIALALAWYQYNRRTRQQKSWCIGTA